MYTEDFKEFVSNGVDKYYIGIGNPNAKILYVGKESAIDQDNTEGLNLYNRNAADWKNHVVNNTCEPLFYEVSKEHPFRKEKSWGKNTWSKYQKLTNNIFRREERPNYIDFLKEVFTTEINDSPNKNTSSANKGTLNERKQLLKDSKFIQCFPVVVLACSNYIQNNDEQREINEIFNVRYSGGGKSFSKGNWYYLHYSDDKTKLVIHTRQLSTNVKKELLDEVGEAIRKHLNLE
ncbi:MAG: hypothetical protein KA288_03995 [Paludibacteraceae bacterium]|nr:hypothetical protein [Paludibacteraceae bacterium]